jgi:acetolactate synthase small subunit
MPPSTLVVQLNDQPGALDRAIGLIRRRDYGVSSLFVGTTGGTSRMVLVVDAAKVHQIMQQLSRLIDVLSVTEVPYEEARMFQLSDTLRRFDHPPAVTPTEEII